MRKGVMPPAWRGRSGSVARFLRHRATAAWPAGGKSTGAVSAPIATGPAFPVVPAGNEVVWVYAVTADLGPGRLAGLAGVAHEPVRAVTEGALSAVVGSVSDTAFGERSLSSLLADLTAIEAAGRAHHEVISHVGAEGPVLPLRLATVYADDETIAALLAERRAELTILLESFRGTQEWDVKVYARRWNSKRTTLEACAGQIGQALSSIAVATRQRPSPLPRPGDQAGQMVLNNAYLLDTEHASRFSELVTTVTAAHTALRAVVSGPWPPYSFAGR